MSWQYREGTTKSGGKLMSTVNVGRNLPRQRSKGEIGVSYDLLVLSQLPPVEGGRSFSLSNSIRGLSEVFQNTAGTLRKRRTSSCRPTTEQRSPASRPFLSWFDRPRQGCDQTFQQKNALPFRGICAALRRRPALPLLGERHRCSSGPLIGPKEPPHAQHQSTFVPRICRGIHAHETVGGWKYGLMRERPPGNISKAWHVTSAAHKFRSMWRPLPGKGGLGQGSILQQGTGTEVRESHQRSPITSSPCPPRRALNRCSMRYVKRSPPSG